MGCTLSHTDFNDALKRLIEDKLLNRIEDRSSKLKVKPVLYPLTERAKKIIKLNLVAHQKADIFRRIYEKLLLYEALYSLHKIIQSEQELGKFLSSLNLNRENLVWGDWQQVKKILKASNQKSKRKMQKCRRVQ
jgi:hypothetical protein